MSKRNELRDDIYQRMHGFKTVKRGYRKDGQSKWYYIDPRGAHSVEDMKEIDVPSENAPNPKLNDILADDMQKNPQDYYIWRTVGDDKVRGKHAEREGKIFNKNVPPEGGNPGEDYNCRCWAEPYKPEKDFTELDISGLCVTDKNIQQKNFQKTNSPYEHSSVDFYFDNKTPITLEPHTNNTLQQTLRPFDNFRTGSERINKLRNGEKLYLHVNSNPDANYNWPEYRTWHFLGDYYINKYGKIIEKYAEKYNVDADLVKAIMYNEAATGHYGFINQLADLFNYSDSQMPMNIQGKLWGDFEGTHYDTDIPEQNIELGVKVIKQIRDSLDNPTPDRIGTIWNDTGATEINHVGARVKTAYETKPWQKKK